MLQIEFKNNFKVHLIKKKLMNNKVKIMKFNQWDLHIKIYNQIYLLFNHNNKKQRRIQLYLILLPVF